MVQQPSITVPPFPTLTWTGYHWSGEVILPSLRGFRSHRGSYGSRNSNEPSTGSIEVSVQTDSEHDLPSESQRKAFHFLIENQDAVVSAMLTALVDYYAAEPKHLGWWARRVTHASQFKDMVGPTTVHVISVAHAGLAYVGFEFGCSWDGEHGLGWMTHKTRIVEVGSADTSFLEWIAENDADAQKG